MITYGQQIWSAYITTIDYIWWSYIMIIIHAHRTWSSYMAIVYDHHVWWPCMIVILDDHIQSSSSGIWVSYTIIRTCVHVVCVFVFVCGDVCVCVRATVCCVRTPVRAERMSVLRNGGHCQHCRKISYNWSHEMWLFSRTPSALSRPSRSFRPRFISQRMRWACMCSVCVYPSPLYIATRLSW